MSVYYSRGGEIQQIVASEQFKTNNNSEMAGQIMKLFFGLHPYYYYPPKSSAPPRCHIEVRRSRCTKHKVMYIACGVVVL